MSAEARRRPAAAGEIQIRQAEDDAWTERVHQPMGGPMIHTTVHHTGPTSSHRPGDDEWTLMPHQNHPRGARP